MGYIEYIDINGITNKIMHDDKATCIDLRFRNIQKILSTHNVSNVQELNLAFNYLSELSNLDNFTNLRILNASNNLMKYNPNPITTINGLDKLSNLHSLALCGNKITKISGLDNLVNLQELYLSDNQITEISGLDKLTNLQRLYLSANKITCISNINHLVNLHQLILDGNKIVNISGLECLINLEQLCLGSNKIKNISGFDKLVNLKILSLYRNEITKFSNLDNLVNLEDLYLNYNCIKEITGIENLVNLQTLHLLSNEITEIPLSIMNLRNLWSFEYDRNKIELHYAIQRFLNRNKIKISKMIYNDSQNVHDSSISKCLSESIYKIISDKPLINFDQLITEIVEDQTLTKECKESLIEYSKIEDVHTILNVTFKEALLSVWNIIRFHPESSEIKKILNDEMKDSLCKCFTGRLSRLINCLNGFDDRVQIKIADSDQIANIIITIKNKYIDLEQIRTEVIKEMKERGFDQKIINEWIEYIE